MSTHAQVHSLPFLLQYASETATVMRAIDVDECIPQRSVLFFPFLLYLGCFACDSENSMLDCSVIL